MEIRLNYIGKGKCIINITIKSVKGERGANVTKDDLNKVAQAIRSGKFHTFEDYDGSIWLLGWTEDMNIRFGNDRPFDVLWGENDELKKVSGIITVSK